MNPTWFDDWSGVVRVLVSAVVAYSALVAILRGSGKRTLAQLNQFDWVVTVALGSTLATIVLAADVPLVEGVVALAGLVLLQYAVAWSEARSDALTRVVRAEPALLVHRGRFLRSTMLRERVTERDVMQALRQHGLAAVEEAGAVVLETNGSISVLTSPLVNAVASVHPDDGDAR